MISKYASGARIALLVSLGFLSLAPHPARALDLTSYVAATVFYSRASAFTASGDLESAEQARNRGKGWLIGGLVFDGLALILTVLTLDHVDRVEVEVANGGGPITDAYAAAFGVPRELVLATAAEVQRSATAPLSASELDRALSGRLVRESKLTDELASRVLTGLYQERALVGVASTPFHQTLADLSGVSTVEIERSVAPELDARLSAAAVPGAVISARAALSQDAVNTLDAVLERIYTDHSAALLAHIDGLAAR